MKGFGVVGQARLVQADAAAAGRGPRGQRARAAQDVQQAVAPIGRRELCGAVLRRMAALVGRDPGLRRTKCV